MAKVNINKAASVKHPQPNFLQETTEWDPCCKLKLRRDLKPLPRGTLGDIGIHTRVTGPK